MLQEPKPTDVHAIADLAQDHYGWHVTRRRVEQEIATCRATLEAGNLSFDEYRTYTGTLKGLRFVLDFVDQNVRKAQEGPE